MDGSSLYDDGVSCTLEAKWEVGKLYHDRPLFKRSDGEEIGGLLISGSGYRGFLSRGGGEVRLAYAMRAANLPDALRGVVVLV